MPGMGCTTSTTCTRKVCFVQFNFSAYPQAQRERGGEGGRHAHTYVHKHRYRHRHTTCAVSCWYACHVRFNRQCQRGRSPANLWMKTLPPPPPRQQQQQQQQVQVPPLHRLQTVTAQVMSMGPSERQQPARPAMQTMVTREHRTMVVLRRLTLCLLNQHRRFRPTHMVG